MLGREVLTLLGARAVPFDRADGQELTDRVRLDEALVGCDAVVHLAAMHPLVAPADADGAAYYEANVPPFRGLLEAAASRDVGRVVLASSTSVWRDAPPGAPARFIDDDTPPDDDGAYASSKLECERLLFRSPITGVALRLARFAEPARDEDEVRKLYRAIDPRDAAALVVLALDRVTASGVYAASAPTPFVPADAELLARDPRAAIRARTGHDPSWYPEAIRSVVVSRRAPHELGWRARHPSVLMPSGS